MDSKRIKIMMKKIQKNQQLQSSKRYSSSRTMMKKIEELSVEGKFDVIRDLLLERENHMKSEIDILKTKAALFYRLGSNLGKKVRELESQNLLLEQTNSMNLQTIEKLEFQLFLQDDDKFNYSSSSEGSINWCGNEDLNEQPEVESSSSDSDYGTKFTLTRIQPEKENITLKRKSPEDNEKKKRQHIAIGWSWLDQLPSSSETDSDSYTINNMGGIN